MIRNLLFISIAPVLIVALYVYIRDKYEKEPLRTLIIALLLGIFISIPAVFIEGILMRFGRGLDGLLSAFYIGFGVASFTEEGLKFLAFFLFFWANRNFNEKFDGIVYSVFISLGFAGIENFLYVQQGGYNVGLVRAVTAVPAHALFGTVMGYHFALARFYPSLRSRHLILAFSMPFLWHGLYDFFILGKNEFLLLCFIPLVIWLWINGFRKMKELSGASVFRNDISAQS